MIQEQEMGSHRQIFAQIEGLGDPGHHVSADSLEGHDLQLRYVFQAHYLAVWLLRFGGFRCLTDPALVREEIMLQMLRAKESIFLAYLESISFEYEVRRPSVRTIRSESDPSAYIRKVLGVVNPVQRKMYGIEIRRARRKSKDFRIVSTPVGKLFRVARVSELPDELEIQDDDRPCVVSNLSPVGDPEIDEMTHFTISQFYDRIPEKPLEDAEDLERNPGEIRGRRQDTDAERRYARPEEVEEFLDLLCGL